TGVGGQLRKARLLAGLHQVFLTHLHSDHVCDYFNLFLLGWPILQWNPPVPVFGPGPAGGAAAFPPDEPGRPTPIVCPADPAPGLLTLHDAQIRAHAYDLNIRMREAGRRGLTPLIAPQEIALPAGVDAAGPERVAPAMEPFLVTEDDRVRVTAVLVQHAPVFPAFAFRFDTDDGSVVISGDTAPSPNLARLARSADVLVHEVYDDSTMGLGSPSPHDDEGAEDDDAWEAERREHHLRTAHTALSEVGRVATDAGAGRLVLTHFIPGDDLLPDAHWVKGVVGTYGGEVVVGHDLLELRL
ncbi:MAG: MBL fold metallo-hydrolase, partial [Acidimicrobiales bacterium]